MSSQAFNISLSKELVKKLDAQAKKDYSSRSDYIRKAVVNQLRADQVLQDVLDRANEKDRRMGITSEQQVCDVIDGNRNAGNT